MKKLGMIVDFNNDNLLWGNVIVPIWRAVYNCPKPAFKRSKMKQVIQQTANPRLTRESIEIIVNNLDSKYEKVDLEDIFQSAHQLDAK